MWRGKVLANFFSSLFLGCVCCNDWGLTCFIVVLTHGHSACWGWPCESPDSYACLSEVALIFSGVWHKLIMVFDGGHSLGYSTHTYLWHVT